jgi:hypothetical protein
MKQYKLPLTVNKGRRKRATPFLIDKPVAGQMTVVLQ